MPSLRRRLVVLLAAAMLAAPAAAPGQTSTIPEDGADVSTTPPVPLTDGGTNREPSAGSGQRAATSELPDTGTDPRLLFLTGAALGLLGVGLRLRTLDADDY